jgi:hypothetical protein
MPRLRENGIDASGILSAEVSIRSRCDLESVVRFGERNIRKPNIERVVGLFRNIDEKAPDILQKQIQRKPKVVSVRFKPNVPGVQRVKKNFRGRLQEERYTRRDRRSEHLRIQRRISQRDGEILHVLATYHSITKPGAKVQTQKQQKHRSFPLMMFFSEV